VSGGRSGWAQHVILRHQKDQRLPGRHITDCQTRLYMKSRQTNGPAIAAAKAGFSTATAYRIEATDRMMRHSQAIPKFGEGTFAGDELKSGF
jgi:hypothetical protein